MISTICKLIEKRILKIFHKDFLSHYSTAETWNKNAH